MIKLHEIKTKKVLDVGAGKGHLSWEMAREGYTVVAIERNDQLSQKLAEHSTGKYEIECIAKTVNDESDLNVVQDPCISVSLRMFISFQTKLNLRCLWESFG